jgi:y4mF family transcriptional regulator
MDYSSLKDIIRFHRKKAGLTQQELAQMAGLGKTVVFDVENGKLTIQFTSLIKIFHVLNINIEFKSPIMKACLESFNEKS